MFQSEFIFCKWTESQKLFILYSSDQHPKNTEFNGIKPWWFLTDFWLAEPNMLNWMNMLNCRSTLFAMKWLIFDSSCVINIFERRVKSFVNSSRSRKWNPNDIKNELFKLVRSIWTRKFNPRVWKAESSVAPNWRHFEKFYFSLTSMIRKTHIEAKTTSVRSVVQSFTVLNTKPLLNILQCEPQEMKLRMDEFL